MASRGTLRSWLPAMMSVGVLAIAYFMMFAPERDRREAMEQHMLMAARSLHVDDCRLAMIEEGLDVDNYRSAGGYVRYWRFDGGLAMEMHASYLDGRRNRVFCRVTLDPSADVEVWQPDGI